MSNENKIVRVKVEATPAHDNKSFTWAKCTEVDTHRRLSIKEHSLDIGLKHCEELVDTIEDICAVITNYDVQSAENIWPSEDRNEWIAQCRKYHIISYTLVFN